MGVSKKVTLDKDQKYTIGYSFKNKMGISANNFVILELIKNGSIMFTRKLQATEATTFDYTAPATGEYTWRMRSSSIGTTTTQPLTYSLDNLSIFYTYPYTVENCDNLADSYRFGFNGKEKESDMYGESNVYDFGARMYDGRIGRWMSADPKRICYHGHSPYNYALNSPIFLFDPNGKWVAKIDVNSAGEYSLTFVAQEKDDLNSLSTQLGIPKETLLKQDPTLEKLEITYGLELKLDKIEQVKEINSGINYISKNQGTTNCANFADRCDGGSNLRDDGGSVDEMEDKVGNGKSLIRHPDMKILYGEVEPYQPVSEEESRIGDVITYKISDCSKNEEGVTPFIFEKERHFSVVVLKDAEGCAPSQIIQKNGTSDFKFKIDPANPVKLPNTDNVEYSPACPKGSTSPINRN